MYSISIYYTTQKKFFIAVQVHDIEMTSMWRHHVASISFWCNVPAGLDQDRCVKSCPALKMKSTVVSKVCF